jgi:hypothetical protein
MNTNTESKEENQTTEPTVSGHVKPVVSLQNEPVKYHCIDSCNSCGGANRTLAPSIDEGGIYESKTKCDNCGFTDYWAYGFYKSSQSIESKCKTYSFAH